jgi:hypothetical protein
LYVYYGGTSSSSFFSSNLTVNNTLDVELDMDKRNVHYIINQVPLKCTVQNIPAGNTLVFCISGYNSTAIIEIVSVVKLTKPSSNLSDSNTYSKYNWC